MNWRQFLTPVKSIDTEAARAFLAERPAGGSAFRTGVRATRMPGMAHEWAGTAREGRSFECRCSVGGRKARLLSVVKQVQEIARGCGSEA